MADYTGSQTGAEIDDAVAATKGATTGIMVKTGTGTGARRTVTGTTDKITVTNGNGVSGNPTLALATAVTDSLALADSAVQPDDPIQTNDQTGTAYTLALSDAGKWVTMTNASANVVTIPADAAVAFPLKTVINISQFGAGVTSVTADTGVDLNDISAGSCDLQNRYVGGAVLFKRGADDWVIAGDIGTIS